MKEDPKCPYCGGEMDAKCHTFNMWDTKFYFECSCGARTPMECTPEAAYAAAMKRERPKGEWIDLGDGDSIKCSIEWCGFIGSKKWAHNFCPNCGAEMRKEDT